VLYAPVGIPENAVEWGDLEPGNAHAVVFLKGDLVGYGRVIVRGDMAQIRHVAVEPTARGKGVGRLILDSLIEHARDNGAKMVHLNARFTSLEMFRKQGFEPVGPILHSDNTHLPHQRMEMQLT
jgi:N-acetylglutamate synthase-like GNAT family acetyltransferase